MTVQSEKMCTVPTFYIEMATGLLPGAESGALTILVGGLGAPGPVLVNLHFLVGCLVAAIRRSNGHHPFRRVLDRVTDGPRLKNSWIVAPCPGMK